MEIVRHLSDEELNDLLLESDRNSLRLALNAMSEDARLAGERPEEFWQQQEKAIWARIAAAKQCRMVAAWPKLGWAVAATIVIASVLLLAPGHRPAPPIVETQTQVYDDSDLLIYVERAVQRGGPEALEPAAMLAGEMGAYVPVQSKSVDRKKEINHEN